MLEVFLDYKKEVDENTITDVRNFFRLKRK